MAGEIQVTLPLLIAAVSVPCGLCAVIWAFVQRIDTRRADQGADIYRRLLEAERRSHEHQMNVAENYPKMDALRRAVDSGLAPMTSQVTRLTSDFESLRGLPTAVAKLSAQVETILPRH